MHSIVNEEKEKYDMINAGFRALSFVAPGAMFGGLASSDVAAPNEHNATVAGPGEKINMEFERHHRSATQTGKMDMSKPVRDAFDKFYVNANNQKPKRVLRLTNDAVLHKEDDVLGS